MTPHQKVVDALAHLKSDQLERELCPTCGQKMPPLRCAGCGAVLALDDVFIHNDLGRFCAEPACVRKGFRDLV